MNLQANLERFHNLLPNEWRGDEFASHRHLKRHPIEPAPWLNGDRLVLVAQIIRTAEQIFVGASADESEGRDECQHLPGLGCDTTFTVASPPGTGDIFKTAVRVGTDIFVSSRAIH